MTRVVVVGAGLAGLVAARHLTEHGLDTLVLEQADTVGGRVGTTVEDGFTLDRGFQVLFPSYPAARAELDLDALDLRRFSPGAIVARPGSRSVLADPLRDPTAALETALNRAVTVGDKLRVLWLRIALARRSLDELDDDTTIKEKLAEWGFSERFRRRFVAPFYGGITLDRSLSSSAYVFEYTFKMLAAGAAAVPARGMAAIPRQLRARARDAGATVETGRTVVSIDRTDPGVRVETTGETIRAAAVVVATDPVTAASLTGCEEIPTEGRGCVTQQFALPERLETGGRILLNAADTRPNQIVPVSEAAPEYAPGDTQLVSATFLGIPREDDQALASEVRATLSAWYPDRSFKNLRLLRTDRIPFAQFAQPPGRVTELPDVDAPADPVYLAGEYTEWSSIQGAMASGRQAGQVLGRRLGGDQDQSRNWNQPQTQTQAKSYDR